MLICRWGSGHRAFLFGLIQFEKGEASLGAVVHTSSHHQAILHFTLSRPFFLPLILPFVIPSLAPPPLHRALPVLLLGPLHFLIDTLC